MKIKTRQLLVDFLKNPITEVKEDKVLLYELCSHPTKKCFFLFTDLSKKDKTLQSYLKEIAINYLEGFEFYEVDMNENPDLV